MAGLCKPYGSAPSRYRLYTACAPTGDRSQCAQCKLSECNIMPRLDTAQRMNMRTFRLTIVLLHEAQHATCMKHTTCDEHVACIDVPMASPIGYAAAYRSLLVVWTTAEHSVGNADGRLFAIVCSALLCSLWRKRRPSSSRVQRGRHGSLIVSSTAQLIDLSSALT